MLAELGRTAFQVPNLKGFNFLISVYRAAGKQSAFTLKALLEWPDLTARISAIRILFRVPKEIFDVLEQSEEYVLTVNDFTSSNPVVKEKAASLAIQNFNSLELAHAFYDLTFSDELIEWLREEFRSNVELLTLAGLGMPVL